MSDPTLQTSGKFRMYAVNRTDRVAKGPDTSGATGLPAQDPPSVVWQPGQQYVVLTHAGQILRRFPVDYTAAVGLMEVEDMSLQGANAGQGYRLCCEFGEWSLRFYATLLKHAQGTTVQPGIGLYNLTDNPGAWTLIEPRTFNGEWGIRLMSALFVSSLDLSVQYLPSQADLQPAVSSRLLFFMDGTASATVTTAAEQQAGGADQGVVVLLSSRDEVVTTRL